jgi:hypothetical protein
MLHFRRGTRHNFDCLAQTSSPLVCLAYSVSARHHQTISRQLLASASTQHCTLMSMHSLLSANGLVSSWAGALCDALLQYPCLASFRQRSWFFLGQLSFSSAHTTLRYRHQLRSRMRPASTNHAHTFSLSTYIMHSPSIGATHCRLFITTVPFF